MIPKEIIKRQITYRETGYKRYEIEGTPLKIHCFIKDFDKRYAKYWKCSLYFGEKDIFDFATKAPFKEGQFIKDFNATLSHNGKYKLIKSIYNDFSE